MTLVMTPLAERARRVWKALRRLVNQVLLPAAASLHRTSMAQMTPLNVWPTRSLSACCMVGVGARKEGRGADGVTLSAQTNRVAAHLHYLTFFFTIALYVQRSRHSRKRLRALRGAAGLGTKAQQFVLARSYVSATQCWMSRRERRSK
jgi:hypothetical protein